MAISIPTFQDLFNTGRAEAAARRPDLTFDEGDVSEMEMAGGAAMADHLLGYVVERIKATYLDGASGDDLTQLADDHFAIQRHLAVASTGVISFYRGVAGPAGVIPVGTLVGTAFDSNGQQTQFQTTTPVNWALNEIGTKTANAVAVVAGAAGNLGINVIATTPISTLFDTFISVNVVRFAGGADEEEDDALRDRVRQFPVTLRRGTLGALEYGAKTVTGVASATAVEAVPAAGMVTVYIADVSGGSSPGLVALVQTEIDNWRAAGVPVIISGGSLVTQAVTVTLTLAPGAAVSTTDVAAAIVARMARLAIGETLQVDILKQTVLNLDPQGIRSVVVNVPAGDVVPLSSQIIRAGLVTVN